MTTVIQEAGFRRVSCISGPNFADELIRGCYFQGYVSVFMSLFLKSLKYFVASFSSNGWNL